jgi:hypothetical protein
VHNASTIDDFLFSEIMKFRFLAMYATFMAQMNRTRSVIADIIVAANNGSRRRT